MKIQEYDKGLVWDEYDNVIEQSWKELKEKIQNTHGGLGIIAADFDELLRYGHGDQANVNKRRWRFCKLVSNATSQEDIELLADILAIILLRPWRTNLQGGFFISYLRKGIKLDEFDAERAAQVLNELYEINDFAAIVLLWTLKTYVIADENENIEYLYDLLLSSNILRKELLKSMTPSKIFISYAKEDNELVESLYDELASKGHTVWKDTHELLPGENWEVKIKRNLANCDFVILCLSKYSVFKTGYFQEEIKTIFKLQRQRPTSKVFCIPVRLNEFDTSLIPPEFEELQYVNLYEGWEYAIEKIIKTIISNQ